MIDHAIKEVLSIGILSSRHREIELKASVYNLPEELVREDGETTTDEILFIPRVGEKESGQPHYVTCRLSHFIKMTANSSARCVEPSESY